MAEFPAPMEGTIMATVFPDIGTMDQWRSSQRDALMSGKCYPGAETLSNYSIVPGQLMVGYKEQKYNYTNDPTAQLGFTATPGLEQTMSIEAQMRKMRFIGVPTDEWHFSGADMYNTDSLDHGLGVKVSGKITRKNDTHADLPCGQWVGWRLKPYRNGDPGTKQNRQKHEINTGFNPLASRHYQGAPFDVPEIELERFDASDFTFQLASCFWAITTKRDAGGVSDISYYEFSTGDLSDLNTLQLDALNWAWGILGMLVAQEVDANNRRVQAENFGFFAKNGLTQIATNKLKAIFRRNVDPDANNIDPFTNVAFTGIEELPQVVDVVDAGGKKDVTKTNTNKDKYVNHAIETCMHKLTGGVTGGLMAKFERVIGKTCSSAAPMGDVDILLIGQKIGI